MTNYPITASGSIDMLGDEFPSPFYTPRAQITDADIVAYLTQGPQRPRPTVTAWEGADMDAYYLADRDAWTWRHCQTGAEWRS